MPHQASMITQCCLAGFGRAPVRLYHVQARQVTSGLIILFPICATVEDLTSLKTVVSCVPKIRPPSCVPPERRLRGGRVNLAGSDSVPHFVQAGHASQGFIYCKCFTFTHRGNLLCIIITGSIIPRLGCVCQISTSGICLACERASIRALRVMSLSAARALRRSCDSSLMRGRLFIPSR